MIAQAGTDKPNACANLEETANRRYAELIREEIAHTVADPAELEAEILHLMRIFSG
jgi:hypothetical protein